MIYKEEDAPVLREVALDFLNYVDKATIIEIAEDYGYRDFEESYNRKPTRSRRLKESRCSIDECQKWVDYDMKKYHRISDDTMKQIKDSGFSVVKDQYGDYEVIADRKDESFRKLRHR